MILSIDLETYSETDLGTCGVYRYVEDPHWEILLIGYAIDNDPVTVIDLVKKVNMDKLPAFRAMLDDPAITKTAYNAQFEITNLSRWIGHRLDPAQWQDTMVWAAYCGLPRKLKEVGEALGFGADKKKLAEGSALVRYFCQPCNPTKSNGGRTRNMPDDAPEKWDLFVEYNRQDVVAERAIRQMIEPYKPPESEHEAWVLDQQINARGVLCDRKLASEAVAIATEHTDKLLAEMKEITHLENPNSTMQLSQWLGMKNVTKETVAEELKTAMGDRKRVLELRQESNKSSVKKYIAMQNYMCSDDRCRGLFQFYGANRTGRFAGRGVQLQNLPQNHIPDLEEARQLVREGDYETLQMLYGDTNDVLSQCIRTAFIPKPGCTFAVADFSAIEARVLAWMADEKWILDAFANGKDIYCETASNMFGVPVVKHGINGHLRQKGKISTLALGYSGGVNAMIAMGALRMGLNEEELPDIVERYRNSVPSIVNFWHMVGDAFMSAVKYGTVNKLPHNITVWRSKKLLHAQLPSGRCIRYFKPEITTNRWGYDSIQYQAYDAGKWGKAETYFGKEVENLTQSIARDCLIESMQRVVKRYPDIVMHVHDEMIVEVPSHEAQEALNFICSEMGRPIPWAPGLLLRGDGYLCDFYKKD